jgi:hypothetical protein
MNEVVGACSTYRGEERLMQSSGGKPEGNGPRVRPRHRWDHNIKIDVQQIVLEDVDRIELAQDMETLRAVGKAVMKLRFP